MNANDGNDAIFGNGSNHDGSRHRPHAYSVQILGITLIKRSYRDPKPELDPLEVVRRLLEDFENDNSIEKSKRVVNVHRIIENTHARRRLEKWSLRVIATYLLVVFGIIFSSYAQIPAIGFPFLDIKENIMITILTTTTANIIGLGLIVLRGHFLAKEADSEHD